MKYFDITTNGFYEENAESRIELTDEQWQELLNKQSQGGKIEVITGAVVSTMPTEAEIAQAQSDIAKSQIQAQINEFDLKRIRALAEPSVKDETTGQTWMEYYTEQIITLRTRV